MKSIKPIEIACGLVRTPEVTPAFGELLEAMLKRAWHFGWESDGFLLAGDAWKQDRAKSAQHIARVLVLVALGDLSDDLADGDLEVDLVPMAPTVIMHLTRVAMGWVDGSLLSSACAAQHTEVTTRRWTKERYLEVAEGVACAQFEGHLRVLWAGSEIEERAIIGRDLGLGLHVMLDLKTEDPRLLSMPPEEIESVLATAREALGRCRLRVAGLGGVNRIAQRLEILIDRMAPSIVVQPVDVALLC